MFSFTTVGRKFLIALVLGVLILPAITGVVSAFGDNKVFTPKASSMGMPVTPPGQDKPDNPNKPDKPGRPVTPPANPHVKSNR